MRPYHPLFPPMLEFISCVCIVTASKTNSSPPNPYRYNNQSKSPPNSITQKRLLPKDKNIPLELYIPPSLNRSKTFLTLSGTNFPLTSALY
mmetsp:Transcript_17365/g.20705  ORF Transcript_17365/g.20705 Transcript_17365/m.20705 type:complete len:91 (-) Transcript_17365:927-1199(-)